MSLLPARVDVVVVGAGVAGLAAAKHLHAKSFSVAVLEAQDDVGGRVRSRTLRGDARELLGGNDLPTVVALRRAGFSQKMINRFFRPLFGGIQLDPSLTTSRRMFDIIFRSLGAGDSGLPRLGMGAVPRQMADRLPGLVHLNTRVASVDGRSVATV
ncbi:MAG: FAD-dependent oxidoreductase, partial [Actinobacteria bacterium]|nr:FAD-dependent oxidoreductase [Actinomycetota bacterium]